MRRRALFWASPPLPGPSHHPSKVTGPTQTHTEPQKPAWRSGPTREAKPTRVPVGTLPRLELLGACRTSRKLTGELVVAQHQLSDVGQRDCNTRASHQNCRTQCSSSTKLSARDWTCRPSSSPAEATFWFHEVMRRTRGYGEHHLHLHHHHCSVCVHVRVCVCMHACACVRACSHSPGMSSRLEMPLSQISTSRRFLSRLSSTIFFRDLDIVAGSGRSGSELQSRNQSDAERQREESLPFGLRGRKRAFPVRS